MVSYQAGLDKNPFYKFYLLRPLDVRKDALNQTCNMYYIFSLVNHSLNWCICVHDPRCSVIPELTPMPGPFWSVL